MNTLTQAGMKVFRKGYGVFLYDHDHSTNSDPRAEEICSQFERVFDAGDELAIGKVDT